MESKRTKRRWTFALSAFVVMALTGCGMYPSKPGQWPNNVWGTVLKAISGVIDFFAKHLGDSYGLSILIVTIIVRLIILPLFIRQMRYQKVMMELQPEMQKIRSKYKGDNQKIQQETMKLYQERGTNPAAGCLPTLIQLPVLYALYGAIMGNYGLHHNVFLGIWQLGDKDPHFVLPVIAALSTFLSSWLTMRNQPAQQRAILFIMPVFIFIIGIRLPAGLVLYWIYTNLFTALQTYVFMTRRNAATAAVAAPVAAVRTGGAGSKAGGSQSRPKASKSTTADGRRSDGKPSGKTGSGKPKTGSGKTGASSKSKADGNKSSANSGQTTRQSAPPEQVTGDQPSQTNGTTTPVDTNSDAPADHPRDE
ncbi:membrane protein insertase YidC [Alicyclobacillus fastidiosus]|uniref:Membrane protein insertase YidC n=1 Tax=Alicyclobacillus fastidiosus TaxID=392011 RepID=A0ABY6ZGG8_9BACL|nr:YidC/Oxa1 family membrane protein insertase [Alicyclobacillus fastidiosus]WAH41957.1 membrane protein insertase YidC [Alicyclobacillus fastidiosus]GMA63683.1 membrane protein insertase YidC 2 [Alicyclobacillus fastidiosus]